MEYKAFIKFYSKLTTVFQSKSCLPPFVSEDIISLDDLHQMYSLSDDDRAMSILQTILIPLEDGEKHPFDTMLQIMQTNGNLDAQQLSKDIEAFVRGVNPSDTATTTIIPVKGKY